jgi:phospholipase/carboxylesterase
MSRNRHLNRPLTTWGSGIDQSRAAVLAVHGRGQNPAWMQQQAERLDDSGLRFYAPSAAEDTWYPKPFLQPLDQNQPELAHALEALETHIASVRADGFAKDRIVLWGFSQGACLLSHFILVNPDNYAGLVLLTGGYIGPDPLPALTASALAGVRAVLRGTEHDPWVPAGRIQETAAALRAAGAAVDVHIAPGDQHVITDEAVDAVNGLLHSIPAGSVGNP